jgi:hypothetical protein
VALVLVLLVFAIPVLGFLGLYTAVPRLSSNILDSLRTWLEKDNSTITVVSASRSERSSSLEASRDRKTTETRIPGDTAFDPRP